MPAEREGSNRDFAEALAAVDNNSAVASQRPANAKPVFVKLIAPPGVKQEPMDSGHTRHYCGNVAGRAGCARPDA